MEFLPLSENVGAGAGANVELSRLEWQIVRVRPFRTVPDHVDMVTATLRSHLSSEQLLELIDLYKKQLEDMPTPAVRVDTVCFVCLGRGVAPRSPRRIASIYTFSAAVFVGVFAESHSSKYPCVPPPVGWDPP